MFERQRFLALLHHFIVFEEYPDSGALHKIIVVFGDYISIYDIQRAVADKATVPITYESRIAKLGLNAAEMPKLGAEFAKSTDGKELRRRKADRLEILPFPLLRDLGVLCGKQTPSPDRSNFL